MQDYNSTPPDALYLSLTVHTEYNVARPVVCV